MLACWLRKIEGAPDFMDTALPFDRQPRYKGSTEFDIWDHTCQTVCPEDSAVNLLELLSISSTLVSGTKEVFLHCTSRLSVVSLTELH